MLTMKRTATLLAALALFAFTAPMALAGSARCTVTEIRDNVVVMDCGKTSAKLHHGDKVKVRINKKKAIEGC